MKKSELTAVAAVLAATAGSICCILPAALSIVGFAAAGSSMVGSTRSLFIAQHRLLFSALALGMIGVSFYFVYRKPREDEYANCANGACPATGVRKSARYFTWMAAVLTLATLVYPTPVGAQTAGTIGKKHIEAVGKYSNQLQTATIVTKGIDCEACANGIASTIESIRGVKKVEVDYPHSEFSVCFDPKVVRPSLIAAKITSLGYPSHPIKETR